MRRVCTTVLAVFLIASLAAGCAPKAPGPAAPQPTQPAQPAPDQPRYGGTFIITLYADVTQMVPFLSTDGASHSVNTVIHSPLVGYRGNNVPTPILAKEWSFSEDGLTWTFKLREGVKWHDGVEFTAADVKYTYDLIMDPATKSVRIGNFSPVTKVEAVDRYTIRITTKAPFAALIDKIATQPIVAKHHVEKIGLDNYNRNPLGTGPFKFKEWIPDARIVLERFEDYFEGRPYLDQLTYVVIPESSVRLMALETGEAHYNWWGTPEEEIPRLLADPRFDVLQTLRTDFHFFGINHWHPFFKDVRVRQAFAYAIDKNAIVQNFAPYSGVVAHGPYSEGYGFYQNPNVPKFNYDPKKAAELLAAAGWVEKNRDGILVKDGKPFKIEAMLMQGEERYRNVAILIQKWLRDIGIDMSMREWEWSLMLDALTATRDNWDVTLIQFGASPDPDHHLIFHSKGGFSLGNYYNPRVDELLDAGRAVLDPAKRKMYYDEYQVIAAEDVAVLFLWHSISALVVNSRFKGMTSEPAGQLQLIYKVWDSQAGR